MFPYQLPCLLREYPDAKQIKIEDDRIFLPKVGWMRMVMHRPIFGRVKNVTVCMVAGDWFVSIQVEHEAAVAPVNRGPVISIDLGGVHGRDPGSRTRTS